MKSLIDLNNLPQHIAVIMDGNGRWAKKQGAKRIFGHRNAVEAVRQTTEACADLGIKHLTLYAFSTENWNRPKIEVRGLMELLVSTIKKETSTLTKNNIRLTSIGDIPALPKNCQRELHDSIELTKNNDGLNLILALSYSGRWEIIRAVKNLLKDVKKDTIGLEDINYDIFSDYLCTKNIPDPELLIRTSGEMRISNFLLWQIAYTELYITDVLWPDFREEHLYEAIVAYQKRERRFGKVIEKEI
ncbi:MAG: isoprenyl transferase [Cyclobacteriaceae bacterium]|nr:isoprenyl transferase [Cyclobacteriaceae bacterium]